MCTNVKQTTQNSLTDPAIKIIDPESYLLEGAGELIKGFKAPGSLLEFITRALTTVDYYSCSSKDGENGQHICFLTRFIEHVVQPWFAGGNIQVNVAKGLKEFISPDDYELYHTELGVLLQASGLVLKESFYIQEEIEMILNGIITLYRVGFCYEKYEDIIKKSK